MCPNFSAIPASRGSSVALRRAAPSPILGTLYLIDSLYRLDYHWASQTGASASLRDLAGPGSASPCGIVQHGVLLESGAGRIS